MVFKLIRGSVARAKNLRQKQTEAERILWQKLGAHRFHGLHFRRQAPIRPYIVDFLCTEKNLVIELDGSGHALHARRDSERDAFLQSKGLVVLRFKNHQVKGALEHVLEQIRKHIK